MSQGGSHAITRMVGSAVEIKEVGRVSIGYQSDAVVAVYLNQVSRLRQCGPTAGCPVAIPTGVGPGPINSPRSTVSGGGEVGSADRDASRPEIHPGRRCPGANLSCGP